MSAEKEKVVSLEQHLLTYEIDLSVHKPSLMNTDEGLSKAAGVWATNEAGIRAVIESRAMELRTKILFHCEPVELLPLRERLAELAQVISLFKAAQEEALRRDKQKDGDIDDAADAEEDTTLADEGDTKTSM